MNDNMANNIREINTWERRGENKDTKEQKKKDN
jgi:hypothetical protein